MITESMKNYIAIVKEKVDELIPETGNPQLSFTQYVLDEMCEVANLGEATSCYAVVRNETNQNVLGEIYGYAISLSGETISLFYTIYDSHNFENPVPISADQYNNAVNKLQGYYKSAISGRCFDMEPSSDDYTICKYIYEHDDDITAVRLFVLTNGIVRPYQRTPKERIKNKTLQFASWDINTLYKINTENSDHLYVNIDFMEDVDYKKYKIPFIERVSKTGGYKTYIAMLPGEFVYTLYENNNTDLLQSNVRLFKGKNGCNKGIIKTLKEEPYRFLAYNNGLTATANEVLAEETNDNRVCYIKYIENFQILNGGQTTASIYYAKKENPDVDLSDVFVQMKMIVFVENSDNNFHSLITRFSNTQTKINPSDYSTNNAFNHKLQELSRSILAPDVEQKGAISHWYYERVSGQYEQEINKKKDSTEKERFKSENPSVMKFDKCDLGKVYTSWTQHPDIAINGPQKCYLDFIKKFENTVPDQIFFEDFVAMLMIYRYMEKKNPVFLEFHQLKAQMTLYTLAMLNHVTNGNLSLYKIWQNQGLSDNLKLFIDELGKQLYLRLTNDKPDTVTFRDFCKSPSTWEVAKNYVIKMDFSLISDDFKSKNEDEIRTSVSDEKTEEERKEIEKYGVAFWDGLSKLGNDIYNDSEKKTIKQVVSSMTNNKQMSQVLVFEAKQLLIKFDESGLTEDEVISKSNKRNIRKEKDSAELYKRIQNLTEDNWLQIRLLVARACNEEDTKIVRKVVAQKDRSKLTYKQLTVVSKAIDLIKDKFKDMYKIDF